MKPKKRRGASFAEDAAPESTTNAAEPNPNFKIGPEPTEEQLIDRLRKVEAVANDERAPAGERRSAKFMAAAIRMQLNTLRAERDPKWQKFLNRGRAVAERLWELGDLACEVAIEYGPKSLDRFAVQIGVPRATLLAARTTARKWPNNFRPLKFSTAMALNALDDRFKIAEKRPGLTMDQARALAQVHRDAKRKGSKLERVVKGLARRFGSELMALLEEANKNKTDLSMVNPRLREDLRERAEIIHEETEKLLANLEDNVNADEPRIEKKVAT